MYFTPSFGHSLNLRRHKLGEIMGAMTSDVGSAIMHAISLHAALE